MDIESLKHEAAQGVLSSIPKLFTVTAGGNVLIAGLAVSDVISWLPAVASIIALWVVTAYTVKIKKKTLALLEIEMEEKQRLRQVDEANG